LKINITFLFAFISAGLTTASCFCDLYFNKLFKEFTETQELLPISQKLQVFLIHLYVQAWKTLLELMYREFNTRYISIIELFIQELDRKVNKPETNVIINAQRTILKLIKFQSNLKKISRIHQILHIYRYIFDVWNHDLFFDLCADL
jgi:hypothetical protein